VLSPAVESHTACMSASRLGKASVDFLVVTSCLLHSHACHGQAMKCRPHHYPLPMPAAGKPALCFSMEACHPPCVCFTCSAHACAMIHVAHILCQVMQQQSLLQLLLIHMCQTAEDMFYQRGLVSGRRKPPMAAES